MRDFDLQKYLNNGIEKITADIIRASARNPRETAFMAGFLKSCSKARRIRASHESAGTHIPPFLIASITDRCNLHCEGCYARANHICTDRQDTCIPTACTHESASNSDQTSTAASDHTLSRNRWSEIFTEAARLGISFILLAGGEPFLRPDILESAAEHRQIIFPVFTNGTLITDSSAVLFDKNRNLIPVLSIEGSRETTDQRRGSGTYDILTAGMKILTSRKILFAASVTVTRDNMSEVFSDSFIDTLANAGCKGVIYVEFVPVDSASIPLSPDDSDRETIMQRLDALRKARRDMVFVAFPGDEKRSGGCLAAGRGFFHINPRGGAEPCPFSPYSDSSLKTVSLLDALQSPLFTKLRASGALENEHIGGCTLFEQEDMVKEMLEESDEQ